ncbi:prephenate/arogenate dehydrogenase family protein [Lichenifustis flavocetrariae]|uniref:prephenate dehydrogenase n=1 Tax=Lichenifustis flavocetrariae TaxID=2949735 RepID=A0AA41YZS6_9HYPH|nr:prephenate/arogenate dehydrogenase family protein [Lichenifustis flavocetrariae]MCW6506687.1 prephenate/arogenate dehydrogenase family protein [Lichenifustis flavocetrariae]
MVERIFERLTVIGLGLIGTSVVRAARAAGQVGHIVVTDADPTVRQRVRELDIADVVAETSEAAVQDADAVVLCVPVGESGRVVATVAPHLKQGAILSDVGSVKVAVIEAVLPHLPAQACFVPAHPVAGTEFSGPDAGFAELFQDRWCILTPFERSTEAGTDAMHRLWEGFGARVERMEPRHHDMVLAITSHVPHLIAYNIVGTAAHLEEVTQTEVMKFSAGGFRDFTRIAASDPTMWRDVFLNNKDAVLEMLGRFTEDLSALQRMVRYGDGDGLFELFTRTRAIRKGIIAQGQETAAVDFGRRVGPEVSKKDV